MTPDQEALLALFKSNFSSENQGVKLLEKLEKWKEDYWKGHDSEHKFSLRTTLGKRQIKLDLFLKWYKEQVFNVDKEKKESFLIHDDLYLKVIRSKDGDEVSNTENEDSMVGVFSKRPLCKGEPILKIPCKAMLIASDTLSLILKVMSHESLPGSFWKPYFDVLPRSFPTLPMNWTLEQISKIKATSMYEEALQDMIMCYKQYLLISQVVSHRKMDLTSELCTWHLFTWARGVVLTRQNPIRQLDGDEDSVKTMYGLVPLYDFFNHQPGEISAFFDPALNELEMNAGFDSNADEQVFMSYGNRSNKQLFIFSGFIEKYSNQNDSISIPFSLPKNDPLYKKRAKLLDLMMLPKDGTLSLFNLDHPESEKCIQCLIITYLEESDLLSCLSEIERDLTVELDVKNLASKSCMKKVWQWLHVRLQVSIKTISRRLDAIQSSNDKKVEINSNMISLQVDGMIQELHQLELQVLEAILVQLKTLIES